MAGPLQSKIATIRGAGGTLGETSQEELQTLAGKAGLQAQPTDPLSAQTIGASPHQVKMAASPQVVESSLKLSQLSPEQGLATAVRTSQARKEATASEAAEKEKAERLKSLGDTGTRVQSAIDAQVARLTAAPVSPATQQVDTTNQLLTQAKDPVALKADLQALIANPSDQNLMLRVNQALGRTANSVLAPEELKGLYKSVSDTIAQDAQAMPDALNVGDLASRPDFGFTVPELAGLLGVDQKALSGYSVRQLSDAVNALQQNEFSRSQAIQNQATSTTLGSAERAQAQQLGREASATGVRASEADMARLSDSVARGDQVSFGGQSYSVEDLLGNDQVSKVVTAYLTSPDGSPTHTQLEQTEPGLVKWIKDNQAVLGNAAQQLSQSADTFQATQASNAGIGQYGNSSLSPELLRTLVPGYDSLQAGKIDTSKVPLLQFLGTLSPQVAEATASTISTLHPEQQQELASLSPSQISALRLDLGANSPVLKQLGKDQAAYDALHSIDPADSNAVYSMFTGMPGTTAKDLQSQLSQNKSMSTLFGTSYGETRGLDKNNDGKLDDPRSLYKQMSSAASAPSLHGLLSGKEGTFSAVPFQLSRPNAKQQQVFDILGKYAKDGVVSVQDLKDSGSSGNIDLLKAIKSSGAYDKLPAASQKFVDTSLKGLVSKALSKNSIESQFLPAQKEKKKASPKKGGDEFLDVPVDEGFNI